MNLQIDVKPVRPQELINYIHHAQSICISVDKNHLHYQLSTIYWAVKQLTKAEITLVGKLHRTSSNLFSSLFVFPDTYLTCMQHFTLMTLPKTPPSLCGVTSKVPPLLRSLLSRSGPFFLHLPLQCRYSPGFCPEPSFPSTHILRVPSSVL